MTERSYSDLLYSRWQFRWHVRKYQLTSFDLIADLLWTQLTSSDLSSSHFDLKWPQLNLADLIDLI